MSNFRPIKEEKTIISIRIDSDMLKTIDELSIKNDLSRNKFINQCITYALKHYENK